MRVRDLIVVFRVVGVLTVFSALCGAARALVGTAGLMAIAPRGGGNAVPVLGVQLIGWGTVGACGIVMFMLASRVAELVIEDSSALSED